MAYQVTFFDVVNDPVALTHFLEFLRQDDKAGILFMWLELAQFKETEGTDSLVGLGWKILERLETTMTYQLPDSLRNEFQSNCRNIRHQLELGRPALNMFFPIQHMIETYLRSEYYSKFLESGPFQALRKDLKQRRALSLTDILENSEYVRFFKAFVLSTTPEHLSNLLLWQELDHQFHRIYGPMKRPQMKDGSQAELECEEAIVIDDKSEQKKKASTQDTDTVATSPVHKVSTSLRTTAKSLLHHIPLKAAPKSTKEPLKNESFILLHVVCAALEAANRFFISSATHRSQELSVMHTTLRQLITSTSNALEFFGIQATGDSIERVQQLQGTDELQAVLQDLCKLTVKDELSDMLQSESPPKPRVGLFITVDAAVARANQLILDIDIVLRTIQKHAFHLLKHNVLPLFLDSEFFTALNTQLQDGGNDGRSLLEATLLRRGRREKDILVVDVEQFHPSAPEPPPSPASAATSHRSGARQTHSKMYVHISTTQMHTTTYPTSPGALSTQVGGDAEHAVTPYGVFCSKTLNLVVPDAIRRVKLNSIESNQYLNSVHSPNATSTVVGLVDAYPLADRGELEKSSTKQLVATEAQATATSISDQVAVKSNVFQVESSTIVNATQIGLVSSNATPQADGNDVSTPQADGSDVSTPQADGNDVSTPQADGNDASTPQADGNDVSTPQADGNDASTPQADGNDASTPQADGNDVSTPQDHELSGDESDLAECTDSDHTSTGSRTTASSICDSDSGMSPPLSPSHVSIANSRSSPFGPRGIHAYALPQGITLKLVVNIANDTLKDRTRPRTHMHAFVLPRKLSGCPGGSDPRNPPYLYGVCATVYKLHKLDVSSETTNPQLSKVLNDVRLGDSESQVVEEFTISLEKDPQAGLGMYLASQGGKMVLSRFISRRDDGSPGPAAACGQLAIGDRLVQVNDVPVDKRPFLSVVSQLKAAPDPVKLVFQRGFARNRRGSSSKVATMVYLPDCHVLLSSKPEFSMMAQALNKWTALSFDQVTDDVVSCVHEKSVLNLLHDAGFEQEPDVSDLCAEYRIAPKTVLPIRKLFDILSLSNVVDIISAMLHEQRILLCSSSTALLTLVAECVRSLIHPFEWCMAYVPLIPQSELTNFASRWNQRGTSFLAGVCTLDMQVPPDGPFQDYDKTHSWSTFEKDSALPIDSVQRSPDCRALLTLSTLVVDLDSDVIDTVRLDEDRAPQHVANLAAAAAARARGAKSPLASQHSGGWELARDCETSKLPEPLRGDILRALHRSARKAQVEGNRVYRPPEANDDEVLLGVRKCLGTMYKRLLVGFQEFYITFQDDSVSDATLAFNTKSFLKTVEESNRDFVDKFIHTQLFALFLKRYHATPHVLDALQNK